MFFDTYDYGAKGYLEVKSTEDAAIGLVIDNIVKDYLSLLDTAKTDEDKKNVLIGLIAEIKFGITPREVISKVISRRPFTHILEQIAKED